MKTKLFLTTIIITLSIIGLQAQDKKPKNEKKLETVEIQTSAVCGM